MSASRLRPATKWALVVILLSMTAVSIPRRLATSSSLDFYHFWGTTKAVRWSGAQIQNPYRQSDDLARVLNAVSDSSSDARLHGANASRRQIDLTGTPLLYSAFSWLPENYTVALALFQIIQVLGFVAAVIVVGRRYNAPVVEIAWVTLGLLVLAEPLHSDLRVGNVSTMQLSAIAVLLAILEGLRQKNVVASVGKVAGLLGTLGLLVLLKPNLALVSAVLAIHVVVRAGGRTVLRAAIPIALGLGVVVAIPCLVFGSPTIWWSWLQHVLVADSDRLIYPMIQGNYAASGLLADFLGVGTFKAAGILGLGFVISFVLALKVRGRPYVSVSDTMRPCVADPLWCACVGVALTLALAPLVWVHYYIICLVPVLGLVWRGRTTGDMTTLAVLSGALAMGLLAGPLGRVGSGALMPASYALSWLPLWAVALSGLRRKLPREASVEI